jgi:hypothetical protein
VLKKRADLLHGPALMIVGISDGDKPRIPVPLVRIETWRGFGIAAGPVPIQYLLGLFHIALESFSGEKLKHVVTRMNRKTLIPL